ncbi:uncharacterized protein B0H18DRAFT_991365 [Fomitopsis serialis]|uniref:uncharacterized protein n=1 Tax=Fomitopsis serialis TaxID=139415 RepID=UPI00200824E4|nr:uncharacterized protein B0H18DRAFT_991365 [Neoantrodia serialis]KAH9931356.1 hypothetical protein B0H18DRAFT_991365 [Neoantrodia serialis]
MATAIRPHKSFAATLPARPRYITIYHPGCNPEPHILFRFPTYDPAPAPHLSGCSHRLVLDACHIISNNHDGFLSATPDGCARVLESEPTLTADV